MRNATPPAITRLRARRDERTPGPITAAKAAPPRNRASDAKTTPRAIPHPAATAASAFWSANNRPASASMSPVATGALPTRNVQVPWSECVSSETPRQVTMYAPSPRSARIGRISRSGSGWRNRPTGTRSPAPSYTVIPPRVTSMPSVNVIFTAAGDCSSTSPAPGLTDTTSACAPAGRARGPATRRTAAPTSEAAPIRRQRGKRLAAREPDILCMSSAAE